MQCTSSAYLIAAQICRKEDYTVTCPDPGLAKMICKGIDQDQGRELVQQERTVYTTGRTQDGVQINLAVTGQRQMPNQQARCLDVPLLGIEAKHRTSLGGRKPATARRRPGL
jgi:hypothetical protein